jgi:hypothetical protein
MAVFKDLWDNRIGDDGDRDYHTYVVTKIAGEYFIVDLDADQFMAGNNESLGVFIAPVKDLDSRSWPYAMCGVTRVYDGVTDKNKKLPESVLNPSAPGAVAQEVAPPETPATAAAGEDILWSNEDVGGFIIEKLLEAHLYWDNILQGERIKKLRRLKEWDAKRPRFDRRLVYEVKEGKESEGVIFIKIPGLLDRWDSVGHTASL